MRSIMAPGIERLAQRITRRFLNLLRRVRSQRPHTTTGGDQEGEQGDHDADSQESTRVRSTRRENSRRASPGSESLERGELDAGFGAELDAGAGAERETAAAPRAGRTRWVRGDAAGGDILVERDPRDMLYYAVVMDVMLTLPMPEEGRFRYWAVREVR